MFEFYCNSMNINSSNKCTLCNSDVYRSWSECTSLHLMIFISGGDEHYLRRVFTGMAWHRAGTVTGYTDTHTGGDQVRVLKDINIKKYWGGRKETLKVADPGPHNLRSTSSSSSVSIHLSAVSGEDYAENIQKRRDCQSNCVNHVFINNILVRLTYTYTSRDVIYLG